MPTAPVSRPTELDAETNSSARHREQRRWFLASACVIAVAGPAAGQSPATPAQRPGVAALQQPSATHIQTRQTPYWTQAAPPSVARQEIYPETLGGEIYVAGGLLSPNTGYSAHFETYDPPSDAWTRLATLPEVRHHHIALVATGGLLYAAGGFSGGFPNWHAYASVYVFDPASNRWRDSVPLPVTRAEGVTAAVDGKI